MSGCGGLICDSNPIGGSGVVDVDGVGSLSDLLIVSAKFWLLPPLGQCFGFTAAIMLRVVLHGALQVDRRVY